MGPFDDETFLHLFLTCPSVRRVHDDITKALFEGVLVNDTDWLGIGTQNLFLSLFLLAVQYYVRDSKLKNMVPVSNYCLGESIYLLRDAMSLNKMIHSEFLKLNCPLSRLWNRLALPRW
jgi:hypothetical protein